MKNPPQLFLTTADNLDMRIYPNVTLPPPPLPSADDTSGGGRVSQDQTQDSPASVLTDLDVDVNFVKHQEKDAYQAVLTCPAFTAQSGMTADKVIQGILDVDSALPPQIDYLKIVDSGPDFVTFYQHLNFGVGQRKNVLTFRVEENAWPVVRIAVYNEAIADYSGQLPGGDPYPDVVECPVNIGCWEFNLETGNVSHTAYAELGGNIGKLPRWFLNFLTRQELPEFLKLKASYVLSL